MSLKLQWHTREAADVVGKVRGLCYGNMQQEVGGYSTRLAEDERIVSDDLLLARLDGDPVATATSYSMNMWVRVSDPPSQRVNSASRSKRKETWHGREDAGL